MKRACPPRPWPRDGDSDVPTEWTLERTWGPSVRTVPRDGHLLDEGECAGTPTGRVGPGASGLFCVRRTELRVSAVVVSVKGALRSPTERVAGLVACVGGRLRSALPPRLPTAMFTHTAWGSLPHQLACQRCVSCFWFFPFRNVHFHCAGLLLEGPAQPRGKRLVRLYGRNRS